MLTASRLSCSILVVLCCGVADDDSPLQDAVQTYADAVAKAERTFDQACAKPKQIAIERVVKLAQKAYREGNRVGETQAWKYVLALDGDHKQAREYFTSLGTLEQVLKDLPPLPHSRLATPAGRWLVTYITPGGTDAYEYEIDAAGNFVRVAGNDSGVKGRVTQQGEGLILNFGPALDRWTPAGSRYLVEHWVPSANFPGSTPTLCGIATRVIARPN